MNTRGRKKEGRRGFMAGLVALALAFTAAQPLEAARADDFSADAETCIGDLGDRVIKELTGKDLDREERARRTRTILNEHFAVKAIGQWVLGRYWRKADKAQQEEYLKLFEDLIVVTYVNRFENYKGETFAVNSAAMKGGKDAIVQTNIVQPDGSPPIKVDWRVRLRKRDGKFLIVDVFVEGVSMSQTQRSEFASVIRQNGGAIDAFLKELRQRVKKAA